MQQLWFMILGFIFLIYFFWLLFWLFFLFLFIVLNKVNRIMCVYVCMCGLNIFIFLCADLLEISNIIIIVYDILFEIWMDYSSN